MENPFPCSMTEKAIITMAHAAWWARRSGTSTGTLGTTLLHSVAPRRTRSNRLMTRDKTKTKIVIKVFRYDRSILRSHKREQTYLLRLPPVARVSDLSGSRVKVIPGAVARPRPEACARPQGRRYIGVVGT